MRRVPQHGRPREARQRQRPPGPGPAMRFARGSVQHRRYQQRRQGDAEARAAVVQAQQKTCARRLQRPEPRRQQAARDEHPGARQPGQKALQQQRRGRGEEAAGRHEQAGPHRTPDQQTQRPEAPHQGRRHQCAQQIAGRIRGVHRAGQRVAPAQIRAHRRQQQAIRKARDAERDRGTHRQRKREAQGLRGRERGGMHRHGVRAFCCIP